MEPFDGIRAGGAARKSGTETERGGYWRLRCRARNMASRAVGIGPVPDWPDRRLTKYAANDPDCYAYTQASCRLAREAHSAWEEACLNDARST
tara:strand:- start:247 stop:525 length:279 start_codon:yes stop_codon:yes gene_type:complete